MYVPTEPALGGQRQVKSRSSLAGEMPCLKEMRWGVLEVGTQSPRLASCRYMGTHTHMVHHTHTRNAKSVCVSFIPLLAKSTHHSYLRLVRILSHSSECLLSSIAVYDLAFLCLQLWETSI